MNIAAPQWGMYLGIVFGVALGIAGVIYLEVRPLLNQFCLVGITTLALQLFGGTVGAAAGKPRPGARE